MPTANFKEFKEGQQIFEQIHNFSNEFPLMVTEFWTGWFDHWTSEHSGLDVDGWYWLQYSYMNAILDKESFMLLLELDLIIFVYLSLLPVAHLSDAPRRRLVVMGDSARIQDEITENSAWFFNVLGV